MSVVFKALNFFSFKNIMVLSIIYLGFCCLVFVVCLLHSNTNMKTVVTVSLVEKVCKCEVGVGKVLENDCGEIHSN